jgi:hypothetical protein
MGDLTLSRETFTAVAKAAESKGGTTAAGEQRHRSGRGLDPLVDPKAHGLIRRSITRMQHSGGQFVATIGLAMAVETLLDTTASMGDNVDKAFNSLPDLYDLLADPKKGVLRRYDTQIATAIFGDQDDDYILCRSQFEMAEKIAEQMTLMVPERDGGDTPEDPQYGLFGAAYLTASAARDFGLGSYHFLVTDAPGRERLTKKNLERVYGDDVFDVVAQNGFQVNPSKLPDTASVVKDLLITTNAFFLKTGRDVTGGFWDDIYPKNRTVVLPSATLLPYVQAAIIGLTEGVLNLQNLEEFLKEVGKLSASDARTVLRMVAGIPIGAQTLRTNFNKVFGKGAKFANKGDIFPIGFDGAPVPKAKKKDSSWLD